MNYRLLGKSGLRVSEAALGTMTFGDEWGWGSPKAEAQKVYETYREVGGNFIDTANFYTNGTSERFMGEFIQGHRESVVLATKYSIAAPGNDPNAAGNHRKSMMQAVEASLRRLQTDYIDLYWVHIWDGITPVEEVMRGLDDIVRQGKVLYVGISDAPAWWVVQANTLAELRGTGRLATVRRNTRNRFTEQETLEGKMEDTQLTQNNSPAAGPLVAKTSDGLNLSVQTYGDVWKRRNSLHSWLWTESSFLVEADLWSRGVARGFRWDLSVAGPFICRCLTSPTMLPFPHPAHRTGRADLPHPALGEDSRNRQSHCL
jgi:aldo/keto reductase family protein